MIFLFLNKADLLEGKMDSTDVAKSDLRGQATFPAKYSAFYREVARKAGRDICIYYTTATNKDQMVNIIREVFNKIEQRWMK